MNADVIPLIVGLLVFLASLISLEIKLSVAIIEILLGAVAGYFGLQTAEWMLYLAGFGGIVLTLLAGAEIDVKLMKEKFKESFLIGACSFLFPFAGVALYTYYVARWGLQASLIAGTALSTTSLAVVYSVLVETGLSKTGIGKSLMAATFITDMGTALALSLLFMKPTLYTLIFVVVSVLVIIFAAKFSHLVFDNAKWKNRVIEPEIKYLFLLLLVFMYFAKLGDGHAVLPAFLLGLFMSGPFSDSFRAEDGNKISGSVFSGPQIYSQRQYVYHSSDEHRTDLWDHLQRFRSHGGDHRSDPIFDLGRCGHRQRGHPHLYRAEMVHAR